MIDEIAVSKPEETKGSESLIDNLAGLDFVVDTAKRINKAPLAELESELPEFVRRHDQNAFVLGGVLERIRREKFWNPSSRRPKNALFERWVEDTCHYSGRKARYLIAVYIGLVEAAIPASRISSVGWSKLRMIAPLLKPISGQGAVVKENQTHNDRLVRLACRSSRKALEAALKSGLTSSPLTTDDETKPKPKQYVFKVGQDEAEVVDAALAKIAQKTGHTGGAALVDMASAVNIDGAVGTLEDVGESDGTLYGDGLIIQPCSESQRAGKSFRDDAEGATPNPNARPPIPAVQRIDR